MLTSREEAEDAVQHAFLSAHRALERGVVADNPKAWLYAIARNRCVTMIRARRASPIAHGPTVPDPGAELELRETLSELLGDLAQLPDRQRLALVLSEVSDLSHTEIAEAISCEESQVKALVFQARAAVKAAKSARETPCGTIQEQLSLAGPQAARRGVVRRHLAGCPHCSERSPRWALAGAAQAS